MPKTTLGILYPIESFAERRSIKVYNIFYLPKSTAFFSFLSVWSTHLQLYTDKVKEKTTVGTVDLDGLAHRIQSPYHQILRMIESIFRKFIQSLFQTESKVLVG